jgi:hypothetical protein
MIGHLLWQMFNWPNGVVLGNLIASAICGAPALWHLHRKINRHHQWHMDKANGDS